MSGGASGGAVIAGEERAEVRGRHERAGAKVCGVRRGYRGIDWGSRGAGGPICAAGVCGSELSVRGACSEANTWLCVHSEWGCCVMGL